MLKFIIGGYKLGLNYNIDVNSEDEFNQQIQMYLSQGYSFQSNFNGTAILKKKSYSMGLLIVLIIFFFPAAILYYLVASEDIVTINLNSKTASNVSSTANNFDSFCENCGHGLFRESKFCPGCGDAVPEAKSTGKTTFCKTCGHEISESDKFCPDCGSAIPAEETAQANTCKSCGSTVSGSDKFCPSCGIDLTSSDEE